MTILNKYRDESELLKDLLIKNLPPKLRGGNEKYNSNKRTYNTIGALNRCKFINFNTKERISLMIFDYDYYNNKEAVETFKNIDMFYEFLIKKLGYEPTYITKTNKGYQFAYHLKNHVFTKQIRAFNYLNNIKEGITEIVGCDTIASHKNYGLWRNPLLHPYYFSGEINYELNDFKEFVINRKIALKKKERKIIPYEVDENKLDQGRNKTVFKACIYWVAFRQDLDFEDIASYASLYNQQLDYPLDETEVEQIAKSVNKYYTEATISIKVEKNKKFTIYKKPKKINNGAMNFTKISELSFAEYKMEVKKRQKLSAIRTNKLVSKEKKKELMLNAKEHYLKQLKNKIIAKIRQAQEELKDYNMKISISAIARMAELDRKTVRKYIDII